MRVLLGPLRHVPVGRDLSLASFAYLECVTREQLLNAFEHRARASQIPEGEKFRQRVTVKFGTHARMNQQCFNLRSKQKPAVLVQKIQWLDPQPVPGNKQGAPTRVPNGKGKHPAKVFDAFLTVLFVEVDNRLGVAVTAVAVATLLQLAAEFRMIIYFAVINEPDGAVFVGYGLLPRLQVNDA